MLGISYKQEENSNGFMPFSAGDVSAYQMTLDTEIPCSSNELQVRSNWQIVDHVQG